jgi:16S rRNA (guanine966-N2)-methyltransferase
MARRSNRLRGPSRGSPPGSFRIIGGEWRGRRLPICTRGGLRPTPDRVRETLFNWVSPVVAGSRCLDLFAGTGALGLEALSRGAAAASFVENDPATARGIRDALELLQCDRAEIVSADALSFLSSPPRPFDLVFVDPPYALDLLPPVCSALGDGWLSPTASVYLEAPAERGRPELPPGWVLARSARAGQVGYHLARFDDTAGPQASQ